MASTIELRIARQQAFLHRYRRAYLRSVGAELGLSDLADVALREAQALIEMAANLLPPGAGRL